MTFLSHFGRHTKVWLFCQTLDDILKYDFFVSFWTTYYTMTFLSNFGRHTILWLFCLILDDILYYDFFVNFGRHTILWLFCLILDDILKYDFYVSFWTTYYTMTFSTDFGRHTKDMTFLSDFGRHTILWLFCLILDDILKYDFFVKFWTTY